jgi:peptide deformylase
MTNSFLCPCCGEKTYEQCCQPFHKKEEIAHQVEDLVRARYSAYVLNLPDYIIQTTHPASPQYLENQKIWKEQIAHFSQSFTFKSLKVHESRSQETVATVTFTVFLSQDGKDASFTEKSFFEKRKGQWLYRGGQLTEGHAPNLATTHQLRLLPLAYFGDPILRKKAEAITEIGEDIHTLIEEMVETMDGCNGIGLAAPQVHHSIRLFVIRSPKEAKDGNLETGPVKVFINPQLFAPSKKTWKASEGCLSIPTIHAEVERPYEITIRYQNEKGETKEERLKEWEARVVQHEYDHLEGIFFIDRLPLQEKKALESPLRLLQERLRDGTEL